MKRIVIISLKLIAGLALAAYIFTGLDLEVFTEEVIQLPLATTLAIAIFSLLGDVVIAQRWLYISRSRCSFIAAFEAFMISQFFNNVLPAKLGELTRILYLRNVYGSKISSALSTLLVERLFDILILGLLSLLTILFLMRFPQIEIIAISIVIILLALITLLRRQKRIFIAAAQYLPGRAMRVYTKKILHDMHRILTLRRTGGAIVYSIALWAVYFLITTLFLKYVAGFSLPLSAYFVVFVISSVAMSIPLAPGGIGTYHAGLIFALSFYGVDEEKSLAAAIVLHLVQIVPPILFSLAIFSYKKIPIRGFLKNNA